MSGRERDTLRARYERNAPSVDVRGDWAIVHARIIGRCAKKPRNKCRLVLGACASVVLVCALVLGVLVALDHLVRRDVVVVIGDGPTASTAVETSTTSGPITVSAGSLSEAWMKVGEVVGFDITTVCADQLEIDYTATGGLERLTISSQTDVGEVTVCSEGRSPRGEPIELTASVSSVEVAPEVDQEPLVISILSALDVIDIRALIAKFGSEYPLYRVTTASHKQTAPKATYLWRSPSSLTLITPGANLPGETTSSYIYLAMAAYVYETGTQSPTILLQPGILLQFVVPVPDLAKVLSNTAGSVGAATESMTSQETDSRGEVSKQSSTDSASESSSSAMKATPAPTISP